MRTEIIVHGHTTAGPFRREITLSGQWEVFVSSQRFSAIERRRFLQWIEARGEPRTLSVQLDPSRPASTTIYDLTSAPPPARGFALAQKITLAPAYA